MVPSPWLRPEVGGLALSPGASYAARELPVNRGTRHELLPPPARASAKDGRRLGDAWLTGESARTSQAISAEDLVAATSMAGVGALKGGGGEGVSYRPGPLRVRSGHPRNEVKPPVR